MATSGQDQHPICKIEIIVLIPEVFKMKEVKYLVVFEQQPQEALGAGPYTDTPVMVGGGEAVRAEAGTETRAQGSLML